VVSALALARHVLARRSIEAVSLFQSLESETVKQAVVGQTAYRQHPAVSSETPGETGTETPEQLAVALSWLANLERLLATAPPATVAPAAWRSRLAAGMAFARDWGTVANAMGWTGGELFSLHPAAPLNRFDIMGAAFLTAGKAVVAITADAITMRAGGAIQRTYRNGQASTPVWETFDPSTAV
jgi:hypothetical protein